MSRQGCLFLKGVCYMIEQVHFNTKRTPHSLMCALITFCPLQNDLWNAFSHAVFRKAFMNSLLCLKRDVLRAPRALLVWPALAGRRLNITLCHFSSNLRDYKWHTFLEATIWFHTSIFIYQAALVHRRRWNVALLPVLSSCIIETFSNMWFFYYNDSS